MLDCYPIIACNKLGKGGTMQCYDCAKNPGIETHRGTHGKKEGISQIDRPTEGETCRKRDRTIPVYLILSKHAGVCPHWRRIYVECLGYD